MAQYGYAYRSAQISTYNTSNARNIETGAKPFAPYVPKFSNGNGYSDGIVTKKKIIPVASRPYYEDESDNDHDDDEGKHPHQTSPRKFDDFLTKVHNEANRSPPRSSGHVTSPDWRHSSQPKPYNGGYADYGTNKPIGGANKLDGPGYGNNKEGNKPLYGGNTKSFDNHDGYTSPAKKNNFDHAYDGYNKNGPKPKPMSKPTGSPVYNSSYGGDYGAPKPINHDGYTSPYDHDYDSYGDYYNKDGSKPTVSPVYNSGYGGDYNNIEGPKPKPKPKPTGSPVYNSGYGDNYDNYNNGEGGKPKPKPTGISVNKNGYGGGYGSGSASPTRHGNYDHEGDYGNYHNKHGGSKPASGWSDSPRKGIQLTKATNNIDEAMELLMKEAAKLREYENKAHQNGPGQFGSRPAPPPASTCDRTMNPVRQRFNFGDGGKRPDYDYDKRRGYGVMNHKEAEKKFNGVTLDHN